MTRFRAHLWALSALALSSVATCATKPVAAAPPVKPAAAEIALFDGLPLKPYRKIREVRTTSCASQLGREPNLAAARDRLRVEAVRAGGNAVGNVMCHIDPGPAHSACWKIGECTGEVECASSATNSRVRGTCRGAARW